MSNWIDTEHLNQLKELDPEDVDFVPKIIRIFLETGPQDIQQIRAANKAKDAKTLGDVAHRLKSTLQNVGAKPMEEIAEKLQQAGRLGNLQDTDVLIEKLVQAFEHTKAALHKYA